MEIEMQIMDIVIAICTSNSTALTLLYILGLQYICSLCYTMHIYTSLEYATP